MRPPICAVCGAEWDCDLVWFARSQSQEEFEKRMEEIGGTGHPPDGEWFCKEHAGIAAKHKHLMLTEAWPKIKAETAGGPGSPPKRDPAAPVPVPAPPARTRPGQTAERTLGVRVRGQLFGEENDLFIYIESDLRNLYELKVGDRIECVLIAIERAPRREYCSCEGELVGGSSGCRTTPAPAQLPSEKSWWDIVDYWNELHVPPAMADRYVLQAGDNIECEWLAIERS
ncbi:MAG: hypothetical protein RDV41_04595 [Planctomycetota bacterium]|nr:hypothetical protein [Planctomycetota bacterium]